MIVKKQIIKINQNPFDLFDNWFQKAKRKEINDHNAMNLATVNKRLQPSSRIVLLKSYDKKGFVFNPISWDWSVCDSDLSVNYVVACKRNT